nr:hypothetical protein [Halomicronema sp. CCY15110]
MQNAESQHRIQALIRDVEVFNGGCSKVTLSMCSASDLPGRSRLTEISKMLDSIAAEVKLLTAFCVAQAFDNEMQDFAPATIFWFPWPLSGYVRL